MEGKGFFASLFDMSFSSMITVRIIQWLYWLALVLIGLLLLAIVIIAANSDDAAATITVLVLSPLIFLILAIFARVYLEVLVVMFKIAENTRDTVAALTITPGSRRQTSDAARVDSPWTNQTIVVNAKEQVYFDEQMREPVGSFDVDTAAELVRELPNSYEIRLPDGKSTFFVAKSSVRG